MTGEGTEAKNNNYEEEKRVASATAVKIMEVKIEREEDVALHISKSW